MRKGDAVLLAVLVVTLVGTGLFIWARPRPTGDVIAIISVDDTEFQRINLSRVKEPYTLPIRPDSSRYNLVEVEPGRIRVVEANCTNQIDVKQGWISDSTRTIVCVPNRLVIRIQETSNTTGVDGIVQ